jgi:uncharacterized membrane protein (DUF4010 family)
MWAAILAFVVFLSSVAITAAVATGVSAISTRPLGVLAGSIASVAASIISDYTLTFAIREYDHSAEAVAGRAAVACFIGFAIALIATRKTSTAETADDRRGPSV